MYQLSREPNKWEPIEEEDLLRILKDEGYGEDQTRDLLGDGKIIVVVLDGEIVYAKEKTEE